MGWVVCAFGFQAILQSTGGFSPGPFLGAGIGIPILFWFVLALLGRPMFLFGDYRTGFIALATAILVKWSISTISLIYSLVRQ